MPPLVAHSASAVTGGTVPILLRPSASDYVVLGEAYVDGMMDGQAFRRPEV